MEHEMPLHIRGTHCKHSMGITVLVLLISPRAIIGYTFLVCVCLYVCLDGDDTLLNMHSSRVHSLL